MFLFVWFLKTAPTQLSAFVKKKGKKRKEKAKAWKKLIFCLRACTNFLDDLVLTSSSPRFEVLFAPWQAVDVGGHRLGAETSQTSTAPNWESVFPLQWKSLVWNYLFHRLFLSFQSQFKVFLISLCFSVSAHTLTNAHTEINILYIRSFLCYS